MHSLVSLILPPGHWPWALVQCGASDLVDRGELSTGASQLSIMIVIMPLKSLEYHRTARPEAWHLSPAGFVTILCGSIIITIVFSATLAIAPFKKSKHVGR
jgi:hypothetical protein